MRRFRHPFFAAVCWAALIFIFPGTANASSRTLSITELKATIMKVQTGASLDVRTDAAEHLAEITRGINLKAVDDSTLKDIIGLLDLPEDSVRAWVAACLGHFGPRAAAAVPKLLAIMAEDDCVYADLNASAFIRPALRRMSVNPPPVKCPTGMHYFNPTNASN
jgi:hypothetical protein